MVPQHSQNQYRPDIDGLRAVAVLSVILFHAFPRHFPGGFIGVDIFFVISGFLISKIIVSEINSNNFSILKFYERRIRRIFPALFFVLLAVSIVGWNILFPTELSSLGRQIFGGATFIANIVLWSQSGYFDIDADRKPLLHLWSLGIEEQFYLIWPLVIYIAMRRDLLKFSTIVFFSISLFLNLIFIATYTDEVFYFPITRFWELLAGAILSQHSSNLPKVVTKFLGRVPGATLSLFGKFANRFDISSILGGFLLILGFGIIDSSDQFPGWKAIIPVSGAVLIIMAGPSAILNRSILASRPAVFIGLISYPIYLWHWPFLAFLRINENQDATAINKSVAMILAVALAWLTYRFVELPVRNISTTQLKRISAAVLLMLVSGAGLFGVTAAYTKGFPNRFPADLREFVKTRDIKFVDYREEQCFLNENQDASAFVPACIDPGNAPLLFVWGDSNAAHLYDGLKNLQKFRDFRIAQYTASACPPFIDYDQKNRRFCRNINNFDIKKIEELKPDIVALAAFWYEQDFHNLEKTVEELKRIGIRRIVLFGPVPYWRAPLLNLLINSVMQDPTHLLPRYLDNKFLHAVDEAPIRNYAIGRGLAYVSPRKILCTDTGCLALDGKAPENMTSIDSFHLSADASTLVVQGMADEILGDLPVSGSAIKTE